MNDVRTDAVDAIESLYRREAPRMWRTLALYARDREVASDAVAEAFALALAHAGSVRSPERWVWKVAYRVANVHMKERSRRGQLAEDAVAAPSDGFADLQAALGKLSPRQRGAVVLHYLGGYRQREIAEILGSTTAAVGVHLHRARTRLRDLLEEHE